MGVLPYLSVAPPICLSREQAEQVIQHPISGPCPRCRRLRNGSGRHSGCWLCPAPGYGGLLLRRLDSREHLLRQPPAIAFEEDIWMQAHGRIALCAVVDRTSPQIWWASASTVAGEALEIDRGGGLQLALTLEHWSHALVVEGDSGHGGES